PLSIPMHKPTYLFLLLQHQADRNRLHRISRRRRSTLRRTRPRRRTTVLPISPRFKEWFPSRPGNLWSGEHAAESSAAAASGPLHLGKSDSLRSSLRSASPVSSRIGNNRDDGIIVFHRFQSRGHLHGGVGGALRSSDQI